MLEEHIESKRNIRIYPSSLPNGSGDQAACLNIMDWLRARGFEGTFEVIYHDVNSHIILSLFGLPSDLPSDYEDQVRKIRFIKFADYYARYSEGKIEQVDLAINAGKGESQCIAADLDSGLDIPNSICMNDAILMNAKAAIVISPWMTADSVQIIQIPQTDRKIFLTNAGPKFFNLPITTFDDVKTFIATDPKGKAFLRSNPALKTFMDGIEKQSFNLVPCYGYGIQKSFQGEVQNEYPSNMLTIITGCRDLQVNGPEEFRKPVIIPVFYDYQEAHELNALIQNDNWGEYEKNGAKKLKHVIKELELRKAFSIADISEKSTSKKITSLKSGQILLLSMGPKPLPKTIFDGLFTHNSTNVLTYFREGQNTLNKLLLIGKPHMRCGGGNYWELNSIGHEPSPELKANYFQIDSQTDRMPICNGVQDWEKREPHKIISSFILEAQNSSSSLSQYFVSLSEKASDPNDRIAFTLSATEQLVDLQTSNPSLDHIYSYVFVTFIFLSLLKMCFNLLPQNRPNQLENIDFEKLEDYKKKLHDFELMYNQKKQSRTYRHGVNEASFHAVAQHLVTAKKN